jgi:uncharacterized RDD family membrane protein YckC
LDSHIELETGTGTEVIENLAGAGSRSFAYIVDWHIRVLLVLCWYLGCMAWLHTADLIGFGREADFSSLAWLNVPPTLIYLLYHPILELAMLGNTPGKRYAGVAVVGESGAPPRAGAILIRNVFRLIDSLPFAYTIGLITVMTTARHVRFGDMVAGTVMVKRTAATAGSLDTIERIRAAPVDAETAELAIELLQRWKTISASRRVALGTALLERAGIEPENAKQKTIRRALERLLNPQ